MDLAVRPPAEVPFSRRCLASSAPNLSWLLGVIWGGGGQFNNYRIGVWPPSQYTEP